MQGRKRRSPEEIAVERQSKLLKKEAAAQLKMQKQMEKEAEIRAKVIGKEKQRAIQPKESVKYVTVVVDPQVLQFPETTTVLTQLSANEYSYAVESQPAPKVILWKRRLVECEGNPERDGNGEVSRIEDEILRLVELSSFVDMVKAHSSVSRVFHFHFDNIEILDFFRANNLKIKMTRKPL